MLVSYNWLKRFVPDLNISNVELKTALTQRTGEIESYTPLREGLSKIVCGEVLSVEKHPKSDHLNIAKVDIIKGKNSETENLTIVCGAPNLKIGQKVAVCLVGGSVMTEDGNENLKIERKEVMGIVSEGMICSERELGISSEHNGIMVLSNETVVGLDLIKNGLDTDVIFEIENKSISHRSDLFCHIGIARELYAILGLSELKNLEHQHQRTKHESVELPFSIKIDSKNCKRFSAVTIKGVTIKESPLWLQVKLKSVGVKPINNIVDITNYLMLDLGQPMHAYDYNKIDGKTLIARDSKENEVVTTLDGIERTLDKDICVIADLNKINGIAGIMGGSESEIDSNTKDIVLEAANFERFNIRKSSRSVNLRTEASLRFEKGLDPELTIQALEYAMSLVLDLAGGEIASEIFDVYPNEESERIIEFDINKVQRVLGIKISRDEILEILNRLQIDTSHAAYVKVDGINPVVNTSYINIVIPSFRQDLNIPEDILEEIARMYGYDKFVPTLPFRDIEPQQPTKISIVERYVKNLLSREGFSEMLNYSFVNEDLWTKCNIDSKKIIKITNPLTPELSHIRNDLIPSLIQLGRNYLDKHGEDNYKFFEFNRVVRQELDENGIHIQPWTVALFSYSNEQKEYISVLQQLHKILTNFGIDYKIKSFIEVEDISQIVNSSLFHPSKSGILYITENNSIITLAKFGKLNVRIVDNFKFSTNKDIEIASINIDHLVKYSKSTNIYKSMSDREISSLDFTVIIDDNIKAIEIINKLKANTELIDVYFVDKYTSELQKTLTLRVIFPEEKSSTIKEEIENILVTELKLKLN
jgi:phenylalanyl-tRNA synthetase beta chain